MDVHVDRLTLRVPGLSPAEGRRLAELVAGGLSRMPAGAQAGDAIRIAVDARTGERVEALAARITARLMSSLGSAP
jgi:hypothetical protein